MIDESKLTNFELPNERDSSNAPLQVEKTSYEKAELEITSNGLQCMIGTTSGTEVALSGRNDPISSNNSQKEAQRATSNIIIEDEFTYPEGGLRAWLVTFGAFCALFAGLGLMNTIGTFQAYLSLHQLKEYDDAQLSWIFSLYVFIVFFCGLQIGPYFDSKGPRILIFAGTVLIVLSMMLMGECTSTYSTTTQSRLTATEYWHFILVFGVLGGLGSSLLFTPSLSAIAHWFKEKRGNATGLATTGGSVGGVVYPLMLKALFGHVGFAWSTRILGFIFLIVCIIANLLIRSRLPPKQGGSVFPDLKIFLDGNGAMAYTTAGTYFMEWALFVPMAYLTIFSIANGIDTTFSYQLVAIFCAASFFGRWIPGFLSDRFGRFNLMILTVGLCLISTFTLWLPACKIFDIPHPAVKPLVIVYSIIFGFASGSNISLVPACVGQLCGTQEYGRYYATCYTIVSFGTLTGIPIAGALVKADGGSYWGLVVWTGLNYVASLITYGAARVVMVGWAWNAVF